MHNKYEDTCLQFEGEHEQKPLVIKDDLLLRFSEFQRETQTQPTTPRSLERATRVRCNYREVLALWQVQSSSLN